MNLALLFLLAQPVQTVRPHGVMAVKPVICKVIEEARGKSGAELAQAIESVGLEHARQGYTMTGLLAGDPPIACFRSSVNPRELPIGAR